MTHSQFPVFKNHINLSAVFGNMNRSEHVLIVLHNQKGDYWLGAKPKFYPPGIFRLVGGMLRRENHHQKPQLERL